MTTRANTNSERVNATAGASLGGQSGGSLGRWAETGFDRSERPFRVFPEVIHSAIAMFHCNNALEVGAGRSPIFGAQDLFADADRYHLNDILDGELALLGDEYRGNPRHCFDISGPLPADVKEGFDLVYSRSVMEHLRDPRRAWENSFALLRPGGIALHFYPTLYCAPFIANVLLPEPITERLLRDVVGLQHKKFPAHYRWCKSTQQIADRIVAIGFREVQLVPFWHHDYFRRLGWIGTLENGLSSAAERRGWNAYSSYCYAVART